MGCRTAERVRLLRDKRGALMRGKQSPLSGPPSELGRDLELSLGHLAEHIHVQRQLREHQYTRRQRA